MIDRLLQIVAPHHCYGCGKIGSSLCIDCKYNIISEPYERCLQCRRPLSLAIANCSLCKRPYSRSWAVGERSDIILRLLDGYKFGHERGSARVLASLLDEVLPQLPSEVAVTYIPTSPRHIRERGFDHAKLLAREFARLRGMRCEATLIRQSNERQLGASRKVRQDQAKRAFISKKRVRNSTHLLIDDIFTTGATVSAAASLLSVAGAEDVWIAVIARQPLD